MTYIALFCIQLFIYLEMLLDKKEISQTKIHSCHRLTTLNIYNVYIYLLTLSGPLPSTQEPDYI